MPLQPTKIIRRCSLVHRTTFNQTVTLNGILATANEHVPQPPARHPQPSGGRERAQVTAAQPAVGRDRLGIGLGPLPIAQHHHGAAHLNLPHLARRLNGVRCRFHDPQLHARKGLTRRLKPLRVLTIGARDKRARIGLAIDLNEARDRKIMDAISQDRGVGIGAAAGAGPQAGKVMILACGLVAHGEPGGVHAGECGAALGGDHAANLLRVVNGGRILGQRGGAKAGHFVRGVMPCTQAPDRGPGCKAAPAKRVRVV